VTHGSRFLQSSVPKKASLATCSLSVQDAGFLRLTPVVPSRTNEFLPQRLTVETILNDEYGKDERSRIHAAEGYIISPQLNSPTWVIGALGIDDETAAAMRSIL